MIDEKPSITALDLPPHLAIALQAAQFLSTELDRRGPSDVLAAFVAVGRWAETLVPHEHSGDVAVRAAEAFVRLARGARHG